MVFQHKANSAFTEYAKKLSAHHIDPGKVITRLTFDPNASVSVLNFQAVGYITAEQATHVVELVETGAVQPVLEVNLGGNASDVLPSVTAAQAQIEPPKPVAARIAAPAPRVAPAVAAPAPKPVQARPAQPVPVRMPPRAIAPVQVAMPPEETEDEIAAQHPAMQPVAIKYGQRNKPTQPLQTVKPTAQEVQSDVDTLLAELDG
jgi:hypothetical protein